MKTILQRLRDERKQMEDEAFMLGRAEGLKWAQKASCRDLIHAAAVYPSDALGPRNHHWDPIAKYFQDFLNKNYDFETEQTEISFFEGWRDGASSFWIDVSAYLNGSKTFDDFPSYA